MSGFHITLGTILLIVIVYVAARFFPQPAQWLGLP